VRHPEHDAVAAVVGSWFSSSAPDMGLIVEPRWCGVFTTPDSLIGPRVVLRLGDPSEVGRAVAEIAETYGGQAVEVWVDGREEDARLHDGLVGAGCRPRSRTVYLALVGSIRPVQAPPNLQIEVVDLDGLREWATVRHMGFENTEDAPDDDLLDRQIELRKVELADVGRLWMARLDGEAVAVLAFYDGTDRLANTLATRVPYRGRGIAQALLAAYIDDSAERGCRSVMINADEDDWPVGLYRKIGFSDEVLFHSRYVLG
jgi:GNAT superfamily N-acetyltransferase